MHDIKAIRDNVSAFVRGLERRGLTQAQAVADDLLKKDKDLRDLLGRRDYAIIGDIVAPGAQVLGQQEIQLEPGQRKPADESGDQHGGKQQSQNQEQQVIG